MADQITTWLRVEDEERKTHSLYVTADYTHEADGEDEQQESEAVAITEVELNGKPAPAWAWDLVCPDEVLAEAIKDYQDEPFYAADHAYNVSKAA